VLQSGHEHVLRLYRDERRRLPYEMGSLRYTQRTAEEAPWVAYNCDWMDQLRKPDVGGAGDDGRKR
jgi:hypothetical protein